MSIEGYALFQYICVVLEAIDSIRTPTEPVPPKDFEDDGFMIGLEENAQVLQAKSVLHEVKNAILKVVGGRGGTYIQQRKSSSMPLP